MPIDVEFPSAAQIGSREQTLDAWVQSGRFTKLEFDLRQLLELTGGRMSSALGRLTLRMTVSSSAPPLRVPREAVPITF
jgi:hypothetical protein